MYNILVRVHNESMRLEVAMSEYDYGEYNVPKKQKTFVSEDQQAFWEAFSQGAVDESERTFFTGNIQAISSYLDMEREREKNKDRELT